MGKIIQIKDPIKASLAECYITIDGEQINCFNFINFEATAKKETTDVPRLGTARKSKRTTSISYEFSGEMYYTSSKFREMFLKFQNEGAETYFDILIANEDSESSAGRQSIICRDCLLDEITLAKFDADGDFLKESVSGSIDRFEMPETFNPLDGIEA